MSVIYYVAVEGERRGPLTHLQLRHLIDAGEISARNLAWHQELDGWKPLGELQEFERELRRAEIANQEEADEIDLPSATDDTGQDTPSLLSSDQATESDKSARTRHDETTIAAATDAPPGSITRAPTQPFRMWTRVGARLVDTILLGSAACILFSLAGGALVAGLGMFFPLALIASTFLMEAGLLCSFGTTPGKALLGVTVRSATGEILSWGKALRRSLLVWLRGLGLGYPLFALILGIFCYLEVRRRGDIIWDREQNLKITYTNPSPGSLAIAAAVVFGFLALVVQSGVIGHTIHFMQTGEVPPGLELPEGFELPQRGTPAPAPPPTTPQGPTV
jgi:uncharacterized RDD family membrane protein YckC